jgi:hypothetical protein
MVAPPVQFVCVIGMHRSGTSVVSRIANLVGVDLGPADELHPARPYNPRGVWENSRIVALNDELLEALGGSAVDPPVLADGWERSAHLEPLRRRAAQVLESSFDGAALPGWKDPRTSLTLPFWSVVAPVSATIHCLRDPLEVARSLAVRQGFDEDQAAALWLRYVVAASRNQPKQLLVRFDEVVADPAAVAGRIATFLGQPSPGPETLAAVRSFVEPELRHHRNLAGRGGPAALARAIYRLLADGRTAEAAPILEQLHEAWLREAELASERRSAQQLRAALEELAAAELALRNRISVRWALRLARPLGPIVRRLRRRIMAP